MNNLIDKAAKAKLILVPKGDDARPCFQAFEDVTGIKVPSFEDRQLRAVEYGRTFLKVKGRDIPGFIAAGYGDIGLTGSDSCEDYVAGDKSVAYAPIGPAMCRFVLLAPARRAARLRQQLSGGEAIISVATSFPKLLRKCALDQNLKILPTEIPVSGSVEIMPSLLGVPLVADLVSSGKTAKANGLVEIRSLLDVYPALVVQSSTVQAGGNDAVWSDIDKIDATLQLRNEQRINKSAQSYTLTLMRDANKAGKKAGEEFSEVMMAILGDGEIAECEGEIADLIYAQLVAAYSRDKPVKLGNVMRVMINRNRSSGDQS